MSLKKFLQTNEGKKLEGLTGGIQGAKGALFGVPYMAGSWQDQLIESFAGTHDVIGGKLSGLYDTNGNIAQGLSGEEFFYTTDGRMSQRFLRHHLLWQSVCHLRFGRLFRSF